MSVRDIAITSEPVRLVAYVDFFAPDTSWDPVLEVGHIFSGECCIFCHTNIYDIGIYRDAPERCPVKREPMSYTTETAMVDDYGLIGSVRAPEPVPNTRSCHAQGAQK